MVKAEMVPAIQPCTREAEPLCPHPVEWINDVPYCDRCGYYRATVHNAEIEKRRKARGKKP